MNSLHERTLSQRMPLISLNLHKTCTSLDRKLIIALNETVAGHYQTDRYRKCNRMHDVLLDLIQRMRIIANSYRFSFKKRYVLC